MVSLLSSKHGKKCMKLYNHFGRGNTMGKTKKIKKQRYKKKKFGTYGKFMVLNTAKAKI